MIEQKGQARSAADRLFERLPRSRT